jgi:sulfotransferase family protein
MIHQYKITERRKIRPPALSENEDFIANRVGTLSDEVFFQNEGYSLYCLGPDKKSFTFVDGSNFDQLRKATFIYQTQYTEARNLLNVPIECLEQRTNKINTNPIFLFSIGRCGSTLLYHLFQAVEDSLSLSEPDIYFHLYKLLKDKDVTESFVSDISYIATQNLIMGENFRSSTRLIIKHRSQAFPIADLLTARMPGCKKVFLFRNPESWIASVRRTFNSDITYAANHWIEMAKNYMHIEEQGIDFISLAYEDFIKNPSAVFRDLLAKCDISESLSDAEVSQILENDSQENSSISRRKLKHKSSTEQADIDQFMELIEGYEDVFNSN